MMIPTTIFEVETRFHFNNRDEAFRILPFLRSCLRDKVEWETTHHGLKLFKSDRVLRVGKINSNSGTRYFIGWKGPDLGNSANIREEIDEEVTDGIVDSKILTSLGAGGSARTPGEVEGELERLGHKGFMSFRGENLTGTYQPLGLSVKLLSCSILRFPLLLEIEKTARTRREAAEAETELQDFVKEYHLEEYVIKEEPPTLLYSAICT